MQAVLVEEAEVAAKKKLKAAWAEEEEEAQSVKKSKMKTTAVTIAGLLETDDQR